MFKTKWISGWVNARSKRNGKNMSHSGCVVVRRKRQPEVIEVNTKEMRKKKRKGRRR